jgi:selenocysteine-specific elongation factor
MSEEALPIQVVATAGHVDHGKSSLIRNLTGMEPDRFEEERRRGLTIDLGFAWCRLPSGREIGFVDVPGHERFVRNMLAGVGPVRLVLFVVAANEGWKPQSEEHLEIVDILGVHGAVIALTKIDLAQPHQIEAARTDVRARTRGTALEGAETVAVSSFTGTGMEELRAALDRMIGQAPSPEDAGRPRMFLDRVFTIKGAGTVVTGTLTGGRFRIGDEVEVHPTGERARIRGLQTHKRQLKEAVPVSRVAANLAGIDRADLARGNLIGLPAQWRSTRAIDARIVPVRSLDHDLTVRGAYKFHAGSAERDARVHFIDDRYARIRLSQPLALDVFDRFVLRESGRRETVAGGVVLDLEPPPKPGRSTAGRLARRENASREELAALLVEERGAVRASDIEPLTGARVDAVEGATRIGNWLISARVAELASSEVTGALASYHTEHPLGAGADVATIRTVLADALAAHGFPSAPSEDLIGSLTDRGAIVREGSALRLAGRSPTSAPGEFDALIHVVAAGEPTPPSVADLEISGFSRDLVSAAVRSGALVKISPDLVMTPGFVERATDVIAKSGHEGVTVSRFREELGTSRKFALPLLEHFDREGKTVRRGDVRLMRGN